MSIFGERIAFLRDKQSMTQEDMAAALGITRASLSHYETNRREPDHATIAKIANHFRVTTDYLLGLSDEMGRRPQSDVHVMADCVELSDEQLLLRLSLAVDGQKLTAEETKRFIAFVRKERVMK